MTGMKDFIVLVFWILLWALGGVWIVRRAFHLNRNEQLLTGLGIGLILENWLANLTGHFLPPLTAFWLAPVLVLLIGVAFSFPTLRKEGFSFFRLPNFLQPLLLLVLIYVFYIVGRGLAVLDDYQNLPITSLLAAGDIPPRFALDPKVSFNYHYLILLFSGQLMRVGGLYPWLALDLARSIGFSISLMLTSLYVQRLTRSKMAGLVGGFVAAFGGGTRWLMLLLPGRILDRMSEHIQMLGAYAGFSDLAQALVSRWPVETGARWDLPFAFANGVNGVDAWGYHSGHTAFTAVIVGVLLLTHNRQNKWYGGAVIAALLAGLALVSEVAFTTLAIGLVLVALIYAIQHRTLRLPSSLWRWFEVVAAAGVVSLFQGGVITGVVASQVGRLLHPAQEAAASYFTGGFSLLWPPAVLSSHLGFLKLTDPYQLLAAFFEIGPTLIILPLVAIWACKTYRWGRWYEAALFIYAFFSFLLFFVRYDGSAGPTALTRAQDFSGIAVAWAVPVLWVWGRKRSDQIKTLIAALLLVTVFGGLVVFGTELTATREPIISTFMNELDARMLDRYWDQLPQDALIFDPLPSRAPTVFARFTDSHLTWYTEKPEWQALLDLPEPYALRQAGFDYVYLDAAYWKGLSEQDQDHFTDDCMSLVAEEKAKHGDDFRKLLDIRNCQ
jgi:hypothetical protein